jgi:hypothetical protein
VHPLTKDLCSRAIAPVCHHPEGHEVARVLRISSCMRPSRRAVHELEGNDLVYSFVFHIVVLAVSPCDRLSAFGITISCSRDQGQPPSFNLSMFHEAWVVYLEDSRVRNGGKGIDMNEQNKALSVRQRRFQHRDTTRRPIREGQAQGSIGSI